MLSGVFSLVVGAVAFDAGISENILSCYFTMFVEQVEDADPPFGSGDRKSNTSLGLARGMFGRFSS